MLPIVVLTVLALPSAPAVPSGHYVESRTAAVFAGACHANGERCLDGREALCVWHFDAGSHQGVELAGVTVALALRSDTNLADEGAKIVRSVYLSGADQPEQRAAALALLRERESRNFAGATLLDPVPLAARFGADGSYSVDAGELFGLAGSTLADRACCKMPYSVWYTPFASLEGRVVGNNDVFRMHDKRLGRVFSRPGENAAFTGSFRFAE